MSRRIGLLTFHSAFANEGAILQATALFTALQKRFPKDLVEIVDYRPPFYEGFYWQYLLHSTKSPITVLRRATRVRHLRRFLSRTANVSRRKLITDNYEECVAWLNGAYDAIVVGSDEIWKIEFGVTLPNIYWLSDRLECRKAAYAASANKLRYRELSPDDRDWIKRQLRTFGFVGVRDNHTLDMVRDVGGLDSSRFAKVPDPTFFMYQTTNADARVKHVLTRRGIDLSRPVLGITFVFPNINRELLKHFKDQGYQTVGLTQDNPDVDVNLVGYLGPLEWSLVYRYFSLCLTNLFHGTIFCLQAAVPFLSFDYSSALNGEYETKLKCLLDEFQLGDRYVAAEGVDISIEHLASMSSKVLRTHDASAIRRSVEQTQQRAEAGLDRVSASITNP
jgi:hypothetical protein